MVFFFFMGYNNLVYRLVFNGFSATVYGSYNRL